MCSPIMIVKRSGRVMSKSILGIGHGCYICGKGGTLHLHHIYGGGNRKASDKAGFCVLLCPEHHIGMKGVHNNKELNDYLRKSARRGTRKTTAVKSSWH